MWNAEALAQFMYDTHQSLSRARGRWTDLEDNDRALRVAVAGQVLDAMEADGLLGTQEERRRTAAMQTQAVQVDLTQIDMPALTRQIAAAIMKESLKPEYQTRLQGGPDMSNPRPEPRVRSRNDPGPDVR